MRAGTFIALSFLLAASAAPAQTVRRGPVTQDETPGGQAFIGGIAPGAYAPNPPRIEKPSAPGEQSAVAAANAAAAEKARTDAAISEEKVRKNKESAERFAQEKAEYEARMAEVKRLNEERARANAEARAKWEADVKACMAGDQTRCAQPAGAPN